MMTGKLIGVLLYLGIIFYLGYRAWLKTRESTDYMLAGRSMNPFVLAMSYGATFVYFRGYLRGHGVFRQAYPAHGPGARLPHLSRISG